VYADYKKQSLIHTAIRAIVDREYFCVFVRKDCYEMCLINFYVFVYLLWCRTVMHVCIVLSMDSKCKVSHAKTAEFCSIRHVIFPER
jgi:hypothetical protein